MKKLFTLVLSILIVFALKAQTVIKGKVTSVTEGALFGVGVVIKGTTEGISSDDEGNFELRTKRAFPIVVEFRYVGYKPYEIEVKNGNPLNIILEENSKIIEVEVKGQRIADKIRGGALTVESLDAVAIKAVAGANFYTSMSTLKDVDATTASLGFTVINTRGFNSTSPVRSLQVIDAVDNQSPGLNFSLGNFLGTSELDVQKADIIVGASSAFYGPNAFNGVISMETKNPFFTKGLAVQVKTGERRLLDGAFRYANSIKNKAGLEYLAYKFNASYLRADDWVADNYDKVTGSRLAQTNIGGYDKVNEYGDEYSQTFAAGNNQKTYPGLGIYARTGYKEVDLVDYNTKNLKLNGQVFIRLQPELKEKSSEMIFSSSYSNGTTVYQGDNRFSLKGIQFWQNRLEIRKRDKYFIRAYSTNEDAGKSYDPYFTALLLQDKSKTNQAWSNLYTVYWQQNVIPRLVKNGYPKDSSFYNDNTGQVVNFFDDAAAKKWFENNPELLKKWHSETADYANSVGNANGITGQPFLKPGTTAFQSEFNRLVSTSSNKRDTTGGTRFFDLSALYHIHGEYKWKLENIDEITAGANLRVYRPNSQGTIFYDTSGVRITNIEYGLYGGIEKRFFENKLKANFSTRVDKNQNFGFLFSPAASLVYKPSENNFIRFSFSSAIRNPTLADQYLYLNVGRAILAGNLNGKNGVYTPEDFLTYLSDQNVKSLRSKAINIAAIKPEKVKSFEIGYRTTLFDAVYLDMSYYYSFYRDFIGYRICIESQFDTLTGLPQNTTVYRLATNSNNVVTTQGFSAGLTYYFKKLYAISGNYSYNKLNKEFKDDPIIPAYNTPRNKFNLGFSGRDIEIGKVKNIGFSVNYKWIQGFTYEGSPQFTGAIPSYDMLDAQINKVFPKINTTIKIGGSNLLNNKTFQSYGGPRIGRLAYLSLTYDFKKS